MLTCVLLALATLPAPQSTQTEIPRSSESVAAHLKPEWLEKDLRIARRLAAALPPKSAKLSELRRLLDRPTKQQPQEAHAKDEAAGRFASDERDIGFGGRVVEWRFAGGYAAVVVRLFVVDGEVLEWRADTMLTTNADTRSALAPQLIKAWDNLAVERNVGLYWGWRASHDHPTQRRFDQVLTRALGPIQPIRCGTGLPMDKYALLMSPVSDLVVGAACFDDGGPPPGCAEMDEVAAADDRLLNNVLRSRNPEARVYAARALLRRAVGGAGSVMWPPNERAIEVIREMALPIRACQGCETLETPAVELLGSAELGP